MRKAMNALVAASGIPSRTTRPTTKPAADVGLGQQREVVDEPGGQREQGRVGPDRVGAAEAAAGPAVGPRGPQRAGRGTGADDLAPGEPRPERR